MKSGCIFNIRIIMSFFKSLLKLIPPVTLTGWGGGVVQYIKKVQELGLTTQGHSKKK